MTDAVLPGLVAERIAAMLEGVSRTELSRAAAAASATYRAGGHSDTAVPDATAALAYAVARMPATYAALSRVLREVTIRRPDFAPASCLDLGAGPGTATIAARARFPGLARMRLVEPNVAMRNIAIGLLGDTVAIDAARIDRGWTSGSKAELVMASYVLSELAEADARALAVSAWAAASDVLVLVEPGSQHGYQRILVARQELIAAGANVLAPCPHGGPCPLTAGDWCHFSVRLPRRRDHRLAKAADAPFEDEPFSYLVASRQGPVTPDYARVLRPPHIEKGAVTLQLCAPDGLREKRVLRRSKSEYKAAKDIEAGDALEA